LQQKPLREALWPIRYPRRLLESLSWTSGRGAAVAHIFPPSKQRPALLEFMAALGARKSSLRRDECGDWAIFGNRGHICAVPEGFQMTVFKTPRGWSAAKGRLGFG
jgi:hypothetical protein